MVRLRPLEEAAVLRRIAQGTGLSPIRYTAEKTGKVWFCGCKATAKAPMCDGAHSKL